MAHPARAEAVLAAPLLAAVLLSAAPASAQARLEAEAWWALRPSDNTVSLARFTALPSWRGSQSDALTIDLAARLEVAPDRTGLGTRDTYSAWSRPIRLTDSAQVELDRATVQWRPGETRLTLGKQSFAWGVLDGIPVLDRFDPVRRRDFVATDVRPERISRWSARLQTRIAGLGVDAAFVPDPTVSQQARPGDAFFVAAPRLQAGLGTTPAAPPLLPDHRGRALRDASWGLRASHSLGRLDVALLAMRGPEADPLLLPVSTTTGHPAIRLTFPDRTVLGGSLVLPAGATVLRFEVAHIPDQPLNLDASRTGQLAIVKSPRTLAGIGMDWQAPARLFVNAQLAIDHVAGNGQPLARQNTDIFATLRIHRDLAQDRVRLRLEAITNLADGDFYARPAISWQVNDRLALSSGADLFGGRADGLFGQFSENSRIWVKANTAF